MAAQGWFTHYGPRTAQAFISCLKKGFSCSLRCLGVYWALFPGGCMASTPRMLWASQGYQSISKALLAPLPELNMKGHISNVRNLEKLMKDLMFYSKQLQIIYCSITMFSVSWWQLIHRKPAINSLKYFTLLSEDRFFFSPWYNPVVPSRKGHPFVSACVQLSEVFFLHLVSFFQKYFFFFFCFNTKFYSTWIIQRIYKIYREGLMGHIQ